MSLPRILRDNRRERHRGVDLTEYLLYAVSALLSLVRLFPKGRERPKGPERLSAQQDREFREWCAERAVETRGGGWYTF